MNFLIFRWDAYNQLALEDAFIGLGHKVDICTCKLPNPEEDSYFENELAKTIDDSEYSAVVSINYFPVIAKVCSRHKIKYISWTCDSPMLTLYTKSVFLPYNYIFVFDRMVYCEWKLKGVKNIFYLPLGVDCTRLQYLFEEHEHTDSAEVAFVGSLYEKNRYDMMGNLPDYIRGYFDALMQVQMEIYGDNFLERMIPEDIENQLDEHTLSNSGDEFTGSAKMVVANTALGMKLASLERRKILNMISKRHQCVLYSESDSKDLIRVDNRGVVNYLDEMPFVFRNSKINLNITLRNIKSGIPLRIWDILGCGGFVLTNFQPELPEYFENHKHLVWYESHDDMMKQIDYYIDHEEERTQIAKNGYELVKNKHQIKKRVEDMLSICFQNEN